MYAPIRSPLILTSDLLNTVPFKKVMLKNYDLILIMLHSSHCIQSLHVETAFGVSVRVIQIVNYKEKDSRGKLKSHMCPGRGKHYQ